MTGVPLQLYSPQLIIQGLIHYKKQTNKTPLETKRTVEKPLVDVLHNSSFLLWPGRRHLLLPVAPQCTLFIYSYINKAALSPISFLVKGECLLGYKDLTAGYYPFSVRCLKRGVWFLFCFVFNMDLAR